MRAFILTLLAQTTLGACLSAPATLQRVVHEVRDLSQTAAFYEGCFGLSALPVDGRTVLAASSGAGLGLELLDSPRAEGYDAGGAYSGLSVLTPDLDAALAAARSHGGAVLSAPELVEYGASLVPDEEEETTTPVRQAAVADPDGYPLLLYEGGGGGGAVLTGVRLDVYEWKSSQTWYEETLGWKTLRWQSNVPSDASVTVTLGAERDGAVGPCGPVAAGEPPVVHARYRYGCKPTKLAGVKAMVLGGEGGELADPDGVPIRRAAEVSAAAPEADAPAAVAAAAPEAAEAPEPDAPAGFEWGLTL